MKVQFDISLSVNLNFRALPNVGRGAPGPLRGPLGRRAGHPAPAADAP
jgi:hypothetical protein